MSSLFSSIKTFATGGNSNADTPPMHSYCQDEVNICVSPPPPSPPPPSTSNSDYNLKKMGIPDAQSDFNQWLHAMKMVARLPGGMPSEFRRKLWLALSDRYLQTKNIEWDKEAEKCLCDRWGEDDEELGAQIIKDLHRTGSSLCSGPSGTINQAKLKRVLLGYSRFNPEIGYCQGFNMLGALILQVMDKNEADSIKVMILLIEGLLPAGYFCGSLGGLQADMAVFRDILSTKLPRLARHLHKLQGPEGAFEPPLTNVFTMQWFLTLFCTCLPIPSVLRIWDLILIEGSDILLRTALAIWGLLEERILATKTADDFYCKMGALSTDLVNGKMIDGNGLVQRIVDVGPIADIQKLREKHLYGITQLQESAHLRIFYSDDEGESDEDSRLAVTATAWGLRSGRRASLGIPNNIRSACEGKEKINLDISLLKKQYDKLRERQRQAHIILTAAVARHPVPNTQSGNSLQVNQLLIGKNALLSSKGKRLGPPQGSVPPIRSQSNKSNKLPKSGNAKPPKPIETLHWKDMDEKQHKGSIKKKDVRNPTAKDDIDALKRESPKLTKSSSASSAISNISETTTSSIGPKLRSESSSYSEESDDSSSTSTSLCDDENQLLSTSSLEASPMKRRLTPDSIKEVPDEEQLVVTTENSSFSNFSLLVDTQRSEPTLPDIAEESFSETQNSSTEMPFSVKTDGMKTEDSKIPPEISTIGPTELMSNPNKSLSIAITSTSQLSPIPDISHYVSLYTISPLKTPSSIIDYSDYLNNIPSENTITANAQGTDIKDAISFNVSDEGVTNQLFERMNAADRPNKLDLNIAEDRKASESLIDTTEYILDHSDNTSKLENYSFTNLSNRSSMTSPFALEPPVRSIIQQNSPPLPASSDISFIPSEMTPIIHTVTRQYQIADVPTPPSKETPDDVEQYLVTRMKFMKEKSFSMDDPSKYIDIHPEDISKRSASEGLVSTDINMYKSSKMSEIIKENSLILDRIIRKTILPDEVELEETKLMSTIIELQPKTKASQEAVKVLDDFTTKTEFAIFTQNNLQSMEITAKPANPADISSDEGLLPSSKKCCVDSDANSKSKISIDCTSEPFPPKADQGKMYSSSSNKISSSNENIETMESSDETISKTDLIIRRTEEQLARFKEPEPTYYVRSENFREIIVPAEEEEFQEKHNTKNVLTEPVFSVGSTDTKMSQVALTQKCPEIEPSKALDNTVNTIDKKDGRKTTVNEELREPLIFTEIDIRKTTPSKTDELIKKTEEQLARFRTHDKKVLEKLEKRLSLIDFKLDETLPNSEQTIERRSSSKAEEVIKKSEEQISRLKIESSFITKKSPTRLNIDDSTNEGKLMVCSSKTEEIIKKTDEQLARFKAAAESNAEKRKSRHEIDELLQQKAFCSDAMVYSSSDNSLDNISIRDPEEAIIVKHAQAEIMKAIKIPEDVKSSKTDAIIKRIEVGKLKLGDDYITTIKTIDYLKQSNANLSATLSSIESSIKAIDGLCEHDSEIQSNRINDTINNLEKSFKQFDQINSKTPVVMIHDFSTSPPGGRCRPACSNRPSRSRKRKEYSPRHKKEKDHDDRGCINLHTENSSEYSSDNQSVDKESMKSYTFYSYYSTSPPITPRLVSPENLPLECTENTHPSTSKSISKDTCTQQKDTQVIKFDKSPSSPIISKSYLESLKPATPIASGRTTRSAENSPPFHPQQTTAFHPSAPHFLSKHGGLLRQKSSNESDHSHVKSCDNILLRFDYKNISAIAASYPVSSALLPSPTKFRSLDFNNDPALSLSPASTPNKTLN
ncbi:serine-rich adhesin for platelets isoform X2 [Toxorhynchites rutilus septentrionalis]|uniref:serine-rich adhesin for platelets isoform X2 n=1 Tax=Toxorhynchites rutilus septentrionalis TaxID=329112 RepID=UPI0024791172|nr:serine-rich adhesin for platelets isoform X2 [Toxorhynchites rutilus septentrionalis]